MRFLANEYFPLDTVVVLRRAIEAERLFSSILLWGLPGTARLPWRSASDLLAPLSQTRPNPISRLCIMTDSVQLAEETEFEDLYLDGEEAVEVTERWLKKYEKRLAAAEKKSVDNYHEVFDEMRIKVVEELATPAFRKDVNLRLESLLSRLIATDDLKKLEVALLLKPSLNMKEISWGLCGLILAIYDRTLKQAIQKHADETTDFNALIDALKEEGEETTDLNKLLESPEKLEKVSEKLFAAKPDLRQRAENLIWRMVDAFEKELVEGKVTLDLFAEEELILPFQRIQAEFGEQAEHLEQSEETTKRVFEIIRRTVIEIITPERLKRMHSDIQAIANKWLRQRHKWATALQAELTWLDDAAYEENKFVLSVFLGQVGR